jgi:ATP-dependent DNA helicase RecG
MKSEKERAIVPSSPLGFERSALAGCELDELNREQIEAYIKKRASIVAELPFERLAVGMGVMAAVGNRLVPTAMGMIVFGHFPQLQRPEWGIAAVRIGGEKLCDPITDREELDGPLPTLLERALAFFDKHNRTLSPDDVNGREYPKAAVREAIVNALIHRDYRLTSRIALRLYDDRFEVWSPGGPMTQLDLPQLLDRGGFSFARNPMLVAAARSLGLAEQIGRGMPRMQQLVTEASGRSVSITSSNADFTVTLPSRFGPIRSTSPGN